MTELGSPDLFVPALLVIAIGYAVLVIAIGYAVWHRFVRRPASVVLEEVADEDGSPEARVIRLSLDACKLWSSPHVIVNASGARIVGEGGSILLYADGPYALDELERRVREKLREVGA